MKVGVALRWVLRESRGARGRMLYFIGCLAVGVAAVVGTTALSLSVAEGFRQRSREMFAADLAVDSARPLPAGLDAAFARWPGTERTDVVEFASMVSAPGPDGKALKSRLAQVYAISGRYPMYGELTTDPPGVLAANLGDDGAAVASPLLEALGLKPGDDLLVAGAKFRVMAAVLRGPPRFGFSSFLGPPVYIGEAGRRHTQMIGFGTRVKFKSLFALPGEASRADLDDAARRIQDVPGAKNLDVGLHSQVGPGGRMTARVDAFLGLVALLSLVVGGIGVAQIVRTWLAGRSKAIAVMRCLGLRPAEIMALSLGHVGLLAVAGSIVGAAVGSALPLVARQLVPDVVPGGLPLVFPLPAALRGLVLGLGISLVFSLPPLTAVWRVPPARVLRSDAAPLPAPRSVLALSGLVVLGGVLAAAWVQAGQLALALWFTGGFVALVGVLFFAARLLVALAARVPRRRLNAYVAHGVAALARPGAGTPAAVVALGLGTMVVVSMWLVHTRLREAFLGLVPPTAPSVFLVDVKPEQWSGVEAALSDAGATNVDRTPISSARIVTVDGRPLQDLLDEGTAAQAAWIAAGGARRELARDGRSRGALARDHRLTSRADLPPDNRIVEGALWSDPARSEVSVEQRFAADLGVRLGTVLGFDVQGVRVDAVVTSVRSVQWQSFSMNFLFVLEPGALDTAPKLVLVSARIPPEAEEALRDRVARDWPNVAVIQVGAVLAEVAALVRRLSAGVSGLGSFCVIAGLLVLAGAASAAALRRRREVALLKTLGVTRAGVTALLAVEYGIVGALAGLVGAGGALLLAWGFLTYVTEFDVDLPLSVLPVTMALGAVAAAASGLAASARTLTVRPIEALRHAES